MKVLVSRSVPDGQPVTPSARVVRNVVHGVGGSGQPVTVVSHADLELDPAGEKVPTAQLMQSDASSPPDTGKMYVPAAQ